MAYLGDFTKPIIKRNYETADGNGKPVIFISYAWGNSKDKSNKAAVAAAAAADKIRYLAEKLASTGLFEVWIDVRKMDYSSTVEQMHRNVEKSDMVVIFVNSYYVTREACKIEWTQAGRCGKPCVVVMMEHKSELKLNNDFMMFMATDADCVAIFPYFEMGPNPDATIFKCIQAEFYAESTRAPALFGGILAAARSGDKDAVQKILASVRQAKFAKDDRGMTALHYAAANGYLKISQELVLDGADVDATDKDGVTPLILAALGGNFGVIKLLVGNGASINAKTKDDKTALMHAKITNKFPEVVEFLKEHGAV